ncbi:uncharacterized protein LOC141640620 [Silene latifolia]|uniref:uncharacterized protein LOC141640620 n=1 Tax=Silene latifolia TaxID=37657 RepID=UPI003D76DC1D
MGLWRMMGIGCCSFMKLQGSAPLMLAEVRELKDRGNGLFRQNHFDSAVACYDEACKLLSLSLGNIGGQDIQSLSDLVVSLLSNMAACAQKLEKYRAASGLCSMILDSFPRHVKALFRRAVASMKLKRFSKAELDLVEALVVEPSNKDVLRELDVVRGHLLIKENGKRMLGVATKDCVDENNKKPALVPNVSTFSVGIKDSESVVTEVMDDPKDLSIKDNESVNMDVTEGQNFCANKSVLEFSKKGGGYSRLRIPAESYKKLMDGKTVSFYRKRDLSTLTTRILNGETTKERDSIREQCKKKKKKRRRCPKKWKSKMMGAMNEGMTSSSEVINVKLDIPSASLSASSTEAVTSSATSICDNFSSPSTHIPQDNTRSGINDPSVPASPPFIFSARPKMCKILSSKKPSGVPFTPILCRYPSTHHVHEKWRMTTPKKNQSQGDESPRHSLSTFSKSRSLSHKFLRPRVVSVSCCRYSSEARLIKKRKEMFPHLVTRSSHKEAFSGEQPRL